MKILIVSNLYRPEPSGISLYSGDLAEALTELGHHVAVVCANPSYPHWRPYPGFRSWSRAREAGVDVHRCPVFVPRKPTAARRILHYGSFALSALVPLARLITGWRPDVIIHVVPTLLASPAIHLAARISGARTWLHVQDFEVDAAFSLGQLGGGIAEKLAFAFERFCIGRFSRTSSISAEMCAKLAAKRPTADDVYELRNWADLTGIKPEASSSFRKRWNITTPHVALYSGAIGHKQGLDLIIDTARELQHRSDLTFIICGNGPEREQFERSSSDLSNLLWRDLQPKSELNALLNLATIHLLPQKAGAADLVLPSKLTNMLASGRPVVATAEPGTGLAREVAQCGLCVPPGDAIEFAAAIEMLLDDESLRQRCSEAARQQAMEVWNRDRIIEQFATELGALIGTAPPRQIGVATSTPPS